MRHYDCVTDETDKVTEILGLVRGSRQRLEQIGKLSVYLGGVGDRARDFLAENLAVTAPKPVSGDLDRPFAHLQ